MTRRSRVLTAAALTLTAALLMSCRSTTPGDDEDAGPSKPLSLASFEKPGFAVFIANGDVWVFRPGSEGMVQFLALGSPHRAVSWAGAGPDGVTLRSDSAGTLSAYVAARPGFVTFVREGDIWVFRPDTPAAKAFLEGHEPESPVARHGAGPMGKTVIGADEKTVRAYLDR